MFSRAVIKLWPFSKVNFFNDNTIFKAGDLIEFRESMNNLQKLFASEFINQMDTPQVREIFRTDAPLYMLIYQMSTDHKTVCFEYSSTMDMIIEKITTEDPSIDFDEDRAYLYAQAANLITAKIIPCVYVAILKTITNIPFLVEGPDINISVDTSIDYFKKCFYITFILGRSPFRLGLCINNIPLRQAVSMMDSEVKHIYDTLINRPEG